MPGGILGYFGSRVDRGAGVIPRTCRPIPNSAEYNRTRLPFGVNIADYISKGADAQDKPGLHRGFLISNDSTSHYRQAKLIIQSMQKGSTRCLRPSRPGSRVSALPQVALPTASRLRPTASPSGSRRFALEPAPLGRKAGSSARSQLHRTQAGSQERD